MKRHEAALHPWVAFARDVLLLDAGKSALLGCFLLLVFLPRNISFNQAISPPRVDADRL
jgi:hypothetical protein